MSCMLSLIGRDDRSTVRHEMECNNECLETRNVARIRYILRSNLFSSLDRFALISLVENVSFSFLSSLLMAIPRRLVVWSALVLRLF